MKRLVTMILAIMLLASLVACGGSTTDTKGAEISSTQKETDVSNNSDESVQKSEAEQSNATSESVEGEKKEISFTELVVVDNDECSIKLTSIEPDNLWGYTIKAQLENKSAEKTYMFSVKSGAINGVKCDPFFAAEVAPGKKAKDEINFSDSELEKAGIGEYTDIELTFRVYDSNDWSADEVAIETVHVYPYGEENAVSFVREVQATDIVLIDNEYVSVIVTGYEQDSIWGYTVNLFLVNKTDKEVMFSVDEASVNGFMVDPYYASSVDAGKCSFSSMSWSDSKLEENDITAVEEIEFKLRAYDYGNWRAEDFANEVITLNP